MKKWKQMITVFALTIGVGATALSPASVSAITVFEQCKDNAESAVCKAQGDSATGMIKTIIDTSFLILGSIAVLMIVIGGIRYTTSAGNSTQIKEAKDTILYSIVGIVIAILAYAIVNFVISRF